MNTIIPITVKMLLIYLLVAVIPLLGISAWYIQAFESSLSATILGNMDSIADKKADQIEAYMTERLTDASKFSTSSLAREAVEAFSLAYRAGGLNSIPYHTAEKRLRDELTSRSSSFGYWDLLLIDHKGNVVFSVMREADLGTNLLTGPYRETQLAVGFNNSIHDLQLRLTRFTSYSPTKELSAAFIVAPILKDGKVLGALALQVNQDHLNSVVQDRTGLGLSGETLLAQRDGDHALYTAPARHRPDAAFNYRVPFAKIEQPMQEALKGRSGHAISKDYAEIEVVAAWRYQPTLHWGMVAKIDVAEALAPATHLRNLTIVSLILLLTISGALAYWLGRWLWLPIISLTNAAESIANGDSTQRVHVVRNDELGQMASSFNTMADQLTNAKQHLEAKVAERTAELQSVSNLQQAILDHAAYSIITTTPEGLITLFNHAAEHMLGYNAAEVIGQLSPLAFYVPEEIVERARVFSEELDMALEPGFDVLTVHARQGLPNNFEWTYIHKDGSRFPVQLSVSTLHNFDGDISGFLSIAIDISERKKIEEARHTSEVRLNEAQHIAHIGNWEFDLISGSSFWSNEIYNLFEIDPKKFAASYENFHSAIHPEDIDRVNQAYANSLASHTPYDISYRLFMPDKRIKWVHKRCQTDFSAQGKPLRTKGTMQDTTQIKSLELAHAHFAAIVASSDDAIMSTTLEGIITSWNPAAEKVFGYEAHEAIGRPMAILIPPDRIDEEPHILSRIARGETVDHFETVRIQKDGTPIFVSASISPLRDQEGKIIGATKIARDITKAKHIEAALIEAKLAADAANKAKSDFLANMSHEIRTPLNGILGMTQLVLETELKPTQENYLRKAHASSIALLGTLNDILDYSKIEAGRLEIEHIPLKVEELLGKVNDLFSMRIEEKGLELFFDIGPEVPSDILGDPIRLSQVLNNLVGNAIKFTKQGEIGIKISLKSVTDKTVILRFEVRDTGIGINKAQADHLFQPFTQADTSITRKFGGTGLGLSICHKLVGLMGGEISVSSIPGQGSIFSFTIKADLYGVSSAERDIQQLNGLKVLVVDDQETSCQILESWLSAWKMNVHTAATGEQALRLIEDAVHDGYPFDVILLDWMMPGMSGLDVARQLEEECRQQKGAHPMTIIMVTAHDRETIHSHTGSIHIDAILEKPVVPSDLLDVFNNQNLLPKYNNISDLQNDTPLLRFDGACILLAEDNVINQEVAVAILKKRGVEVTVANNGREAVDWVQRKTFDVVLMDLHMPVMDGLEAARLIRELFSEEALPIIAMTAAVMQEDREHCNAVGMVDFLVKPIDPTELTLCLQKWAKVSATQHNEGGNHVKFATKPDYIPPHLSGNIPGFDFVQTLIRMDGNHELLARLLQSFAVAQATTLAKLDEHLRAGERSQALLLLHSMRGSATAIGAVELAVSTQQLEDELKAGSDPPSLPAFEAALETAIHTIKSICKADTTATIETDIELSELSNLLKATIPYLQNGELIPDMQMQALTQLSRRNLQVKSLAKLIWQIDQFDHSAALASVVELVAALEMESRNDAP